MRRREVTEDELQLWQTVTQHDRKLEQPRFLETALTALPRIEMRPTDARMPVFSPGMMSAPLAIGAYAGIDRNTADRFRKGELVVDGVMDLHGMSLEKAHVAVSGFLQAHYGRGSRCLLVITGKGVRKAGENAAKGVLREMLPAWLEEPGLRPLVLACDVAKPKHGGSGAYYVLLRRKR
jgi:DNA-nicking Smr family endonuclease